MALNYQYITTEEDFLLVIKEIKEYCSDPRWQDKKPIVAIDLETFGKLLTDREGKKNIKDVPMPIPFEGTEPTGLTRTIQIGLNPIYNPKYPSPGKQYIIDCIYVDNELIARELKFIEDINVLGHNIKYDYQFLYVQFGIDLKYCVDTMITSKVLLAGDPVHHGLDESYERFLDPIWFKKETGMNFKEYSFFKKKNQSSDWSGSLTDMQLRYAAEDVFFLFYVVEQQEEWIRDYIKVYESDTRPKQKILSVIKLENDLIPVFAQAELRGMPFDVDYHQTVINDLQLRMDEAYNELEFTTIKMKKMSNEWCWLSDKQIHKVSGLKRIVWEEPEVIPMNMRSPKQLTEELNKIFQRDLGEDFHVVKRTREGEKLTTGEDDIKEAFYRNYNQLKDDTKTKIRWILQHKKMSSLLSKFGQKMVGYCTPNGFIYPSWHQIGRDENAVDTGRSSCSSPNCFPGQVEVLTDQGWIRFDKLQDQKVAQYSIKTGKISFISPSSKICFPYKGSLLKYQPDKGPNLLCTPDHRILAKPKNGNKWRISGYKFRRADEICQDLVLPIAGVYEGGKNHLVENELILLAAIQADGHIIDYKTHSNVVFAFSKERKIRRLISALEGLGLKYRVSDKNPETLKPNQKPIKVFTVYELPLQYKLKEFGSWLLDLDRSSFEFMAKEVWFWDGCYSREDGYCSAIKSNSDWVQILQMLTNNGASVCLDPEEGVDYWRTYKINRPYAWTGANHQNYKSFEPFSGNVYCVSTPEDTIIIRHNNRSLIVGNCQQILSKASEDGLCPQSKIGNMHPTIFRKSFAAKDGWDLVVADLAQIEPRIASEVCKVKELIKKFQDDYKGIIKFDFHAWTAKILMGLGVEPDSKSFERKYIGKTMGLAFLYGKWWKTAKEWMFKKTDGKVDWSDDEAKAVYNRFFENAPEFKKALDNWERQVSKKAELNGFSLVFAKHTKNRSKIPYAVATTIMGRPRRFTLRPEHFFYEEEKYSWDIDFSVDDKSFFLMVEVKTTKIKREMPDQCFQKDHVICDKCGKKDKDGNILAGQNIYTERLRAAKGEGFNSVIQGSASDLLKLGALKTHRRLISNNIVGDEGIIGFVHDEILLHVRKEHSELAKTILIEEMEAAGGQILDLVPVIADGGIGRTWAEAKP